MLRRIFAGLVVVALGTGFAPAPKPKPKPKNEAKMLEGTWEVTGRGADKMPAGMKTTTTIANGICTFETVGGKGPATPTIKYKMTVDATKTPPWLDLETDQGGRTIKVLGIYQLKGDTLTYTYTLDLRAVGGKVTGNVDPKRPTKFTGPGQTITL